MFKMSTADGDRHTTAGKSFTAALSIGFLQKTRSAAMRLSTRKLFFGFDCSLCQTPSFPPNVIIPWIEI